MNILEFALAKKMGGPGGVPINNQDKTITQNGTYTADEGFTGLGTVNVNVAREDQMDIAKQLDNMIDRSITEISSNVTSIGNSAFSSCSALTTADFPAATSIGNNAFDGCSALTTADFPAVTSIGTYAFSSCSALTTADFQAATSIGDSAFSSCSALTTADFPVAKSIGTYAFSSCSALTTADFQAATSIGDYAFLNCSALTTADFPVAKSIGTYAFNGCKPLTTADFPVAKSIGSNAFNGCSQLTTLILRSATMCTLSNTNAFTSTPIKSGTGYIYVPAALVDSYKAASKWSTYATQFRALEDYTVDGTITGALDSTKI